MSLNPANFLFEKIKGLNLRKTFYLYSAMLFNVLLGYVVTKLNTEYLTLTEFGMYNLFINTILFAGVFFSLGLFESTSRLIAVEPDKKRARELFGTNLVITLLLGFALNLLVLTLSFFFDRIFEVNIGFLLVMLWPLVFGILLQNMLHITLRGFNYAGLLSLLTMAPRFCYLVALLTLMLVGIYTLHNALLSYLISILFITLLISALVRPRFSQMGRGYRTLLKEIKNFGHHLYFANIFSSISLHADKLILAYFLDARQLAYYSLAYTLTAPLQYFSHALTTSAYKNFAHYQRIPKRHLAINALVAFSGAVALVFLSELIIIHLFSREFAPSIPVFIILTIAFAVSALSVPYTMFFKAQGRSKDVRNITISVQIMLLLLTIILVPWIGIIGAAIAALISCMLDYALYWIFYRRIFRK